MMEKDNHSQQLPDSPVLIPAAWDRKMLSEDDSWIYRLSEPEVLEIEAALEDLKNRGLRHEEVTADHAHMDQFGETVADLIDEIENGRGVALLKGIPVAGKPVQDLELLYAAISSHLGRSIVQDTAGTLIDRVEDRGISYDNIAVRGYTTNAKLTPHCDSGDIVALLCVTKAKSGGMNTIASSIAIYNEVLRTNPELLEPLQNGFHYNIRGNGPPGEYENITAHRVPVYSFHEGKLSCRFNAKAMLTAEQLPGAPALTQVEKDAINKVAELAVRPDLSYDVMLEPGDLLLLCNHSVFHTRSAFEDGDEPEQKRLLLRKWINIPNGRPLTWEFADHYNTGPREGPFVNAAAVD